MNPNFNRKYKLLSVYQFLPFLNRKNSKKISEFSNGIAAVCLKHRYTLFILVYLYSSTKSRENLPITSMTETSW